MAQIIILKDCLTIIKHYYISTYISSFTSNSVDDPGAIAPGGEGHKRFYTLIPLQREDTTVTTNLASPAGQNAVQVELWDVFSPLQLPKGGNPLGVIRGSFGEGEMAKIAQELGDKLRLSETVFVPAELEVGSVVPIRIFTPNGEIPFAGHPSLGAAVAVAGSQSEVTLQEPAGDVQVTMNQNGEGKFWANLTAPLLPVFNEVNLDPALVLQALGFKTPIALKVVGIWNAGLPFLLVELQSSQAIARIKPDLEQIARLTTDVGAKGIYVFAHAYKSEPIWDVRMFAPNLGIAEDPATGGAATAFAGYLATRPDQPNRIYAQIRQGYMMGQPSLIFVNGYRDQDSKLEKIGIGGIVAFDKTINFNF